jgi:hypothetical protein
MDDQAETLADIQTYLQNNLGVNYTIGGLSDLCKRLKINGAARAAKGWSPSECAPTTRSSRRF